MSDGLIFIDRPPDEPSASDVDGHIAQRSDADAPNGPGASRLALAVVVVLTIFAVAIFWSTRSDDAAVDESMPTTTVTTIAPALSVDVYRRIAPSIVLIETTGATPRADDGLGTGVIITDRGVILTSFHVVDGAEEIRVTFADGVTGTAVVDQADPANDTALLVADASPGVIVPAVLGGAGRLSVGDEAYAVGNPLGLTSSLSAGVVSALDRSIPRPDGGTLDGLIQFDAAVNPGNSGGPLLDRNGVVVGIVTALVSASDDPSFSGIGFAVTFEGGAGGIGPGQ